MPPYRRPTHTVAPSNSSKPSIIVISSDEEETAVSNTLSAPKRSSQRPGCSRAQATLPEDATTKVEEPEFEDLRRRCRELEQARSPHCSINPTNNPHPPSPNFLGTKRLTH